MAAAAFLEALWLFRLCLFPSPEGLAARCVTRFLFASLLDRVLARMVLEAV